MDNFRTKNDKPRIFLEHECIFLPVNVTFFDAVCMIHDVIRTANPFQNTAKSCLSALEIIELNKLDVGREMKYEHSVAVYQKYLTRLGEMIILSPRLEYYLFSQPR